MLSIIWRTIVEPVTLPKHIDDPITLLIWSADEFVPFAVVMLLGILIGQLTLSLILSAGLIKAYRRFRDNRPDGYALHAFYWTGLLPNRGITVPNPFIRNFYP
jgi:conjugal transfer pilus assembly protein TraL